MTTATGTEPDGAKEREPSPSPRPPKSGPPITERLWFLDGVLVLCELAVVAAPLVYYLRPRGEALAFAVRALPAIVVLFAIAWWSVVGPRRAAIVRAMAVRRSGRVLPSQLRRRAERAIQGLPILAVWWRTVLYAVSVGALASVAVARNVLAGDEALNLAVIAAGHGFAVSSLRGLWYEHVLALRDERIFPDEDAIDRLHRRYWRRILFESLTIGVAGVVSIALFSWFFVRLSVEQYAQFELALILVSFVLLGVWVTSVQRWTRPIEKYFAASSQKALPLGETRELAVAAYRALATLPYRMALWKLVAWWAAILALAWHGIRGLNIDREEITVLAGAAMVLTVGLALWEAWGHRATLAPLLSTVAAVHRLDIRTVGRAVTLRGKMVASFSLLAIFSTGLSLFLSFVHYRGMATGLIQRESEVRLSTLVAELDQQARQRPMNQGIIVRELGRFASEMAKKADEPALIFVPAGPEARALYIGQGHVLSEIEDPIERTLRRRNRGRLDFPSQQWSGAYSRLELAGNDFGSVALLLPGYRTRISMAPQLRALLGVFVLLFIGSIGIVQLVARDLTGPLQKLEQRAAQMASGDLARAVPPSGEADEVGRLTYALEELRRALNDRLRSSTEINIALEREVQKRTAELEGRNKELAETLAQLQRTQAELVRSEKLASMGRLVAGIAHEINNPVNAIANTAGPLAASIDALATTPPTKDDLAELREMLTVIQRGARRTTEIVQALHSYSRRDDEKIVDVDLGRTLDETLDLLRHHLKSIAIDKRYEGIGSVRGNAGQLGQVFMNLLTNAAQAITDSGVGGKITIRAARAPDSNTVVVAIEDDGPGIPEAQQKKIFDPFFTTKDVGKGSGLGLSIVQGLIDRHGGAISVESQTGARHGTTFTVTLPPAHLAVAAPVETTT